jgi:hypothetical protein
MARKGTAPGRKTFTPDELKGFERANAARQKQPEQSRGERMLEEKLKRGKEHNERWSR